MNKRTLASGHDCCIALLNLLSPRLIFGILFAISGCLGIGKIGLSTAYAGGEFLNKDLNLLYYDNGRLCPCWIENGELSQMITEGLYEQRYSVNYRAKQTEMANTMLRGLSRKLYVAFSPRVVVKPFIIVEELQNALFTIRSKVYKSKVQIDETFQAKSAQLSNQIAKLKKIKKRKPLAFSPYYNRIYGIYLAIEW